jgi:hypothetical protein
VESNFCKERPGAHEGGESDHCHHDTLRVEGGHKELVCCFCGDLFLGDIASTEHGEYAPPWPAAGVKSSKRSVQKRRERHS